jgi:fermentation-respiration switch protein FrsA (DUF1100 family)
MRLAPWLLALGVAACASLDAFLYNPKRVDHYTFAYDASVPEKWRVPDALREEPTMPADDGSTVYAVMLWRPPAERATAPTILYHHGNKWGIDEYWVRASHLWSLGANVLVYDYPGYGRCDGTPTEAGIYSHARAALGYLRGLGAAIDQGRLFNYGYSLGGGPAIDTAAHHGPFRGLVTESTFASVAALVEDGSLVVPRSFVTRNVFDNVGKMQSAAIASTSGALVFHGDADDFVQPKYAEQLFDAIGAAAPRQLVRVPGADHGTVPDSPLYDAALTAFLSR